MKKILFLLLISFVAVSCSKKSDDTTSSSGYSNSLTLGTGVNYSNFTLTGAGTSFSKNSTIYFRLESSDDMAGSKVRLVFYKGDGTYYSTAPDYDNPQSYGHIFISGFSLPDAGSFKVTGILVTGNKTIASANFTLN